MEKHYKILQFKKNKIILPFIETTIAYFALLLRIIKGWAVSEAFKPENVLSSNSLLKSISKWFYKEIKTRKL